MSKHHQQPEHEPALAASLSGNAYELVETLVCEADWQEWAIAELSNGGPRHKQVYSALLLARMHNLVLSIEQITKSRFKACEGLETESLKDEGTIPVALPFTVAGKEAFDATAEAVSHAPAHEIFAFNTLLQSIEWSIAALAKPSPK